MEPTRRDNRGAARLIRNVTCREAYGLTIGMTDIGAVRVLVERRQNPTVTIMALAVRSCDYLLSETRRGEL